VERIRPKTLEPFNFEEANISGELWLAEGFTQYYGNLIMGRTRRAKRDQTVAILTRAADTIRTGPGRQFRSTVAMSQMAPFTDAARSVDKTNFSTTFISYYTYGPALALALDLSLRDRSNGKISLDDYMRVMWRVHGKPGGPEPGLVARPYTLQDARDRLAEASGDRAFADEFFDKYVEGREVPDYARLLHRAGYLFKKRAGGWIGPPGGLQAALKHKKPGERLTVTFRRRGGATGTAAILEGRSIVRGRRRRVDWWCVDARSESVPRGVARFESRELNRARPIGRGGCPTNVRACEAFGFSRNRCDA
jgi:predicted metalloprotease with PDZ domain